MSKMEAQKPNRRPKKRKITIWWRKDMHGNWFVKSAIQDVKALNGLTQCEGDKFTEVEVEEPGE